MGNAELLIIFIAAKAAKIVSLRVKEQVVQVGQRALYCRRLAGAQLAVYLKQSLIAVGLRVGLNGTVTLKDSLVEPFVVSEKISYLLVGAKAQSPDEYSQRDLSVFVDTNPCAAVGVHFVLEPCASVRDDLRFEQVCSRFILIAGEINSGRTHQLRNDNTLRAVYNKRSAVGHEREIAHEDLAFLDLARFGVCKPCHHHKTCRVGYVALLALRNGIFQIIVEAVINKGHLKCSVIVRDRRHFAEYLPQTLIQKPVVRILLNLDKVGHIQHFVNSCEALSHIFAELNVLDIHHRLITP